LRETLTAAMYCAQEIGFEVVYGDTDSLFVKREDASKEDYDGLALEIERRTGLPISLDHYYKFLVLLPLEADPSGNMEAQKHLLRGADQWGAGGQRDRDEAPRCSEVHNGVPEGTVYWREGMCSNGLT